MFFYEWVIPLLIGLLAAGAFFYITVRNRTGAGIRTDGRVLFHKHEAEDESVLRD